MLRDLLVVALYISDVRAKSLHGPALLVAKRVGKNDFQVVPLSSTDIGERHACGAGGILDDGAAGSEIAGALSVFDGGSCHAVLHAASWVGPLSFRYDSRATFGNNDSQLDEWCFSNGREHTSDRVRHVSSTSGLSAVIVSRFRS